MRTYQDRLGKFHDKIKAKLINNNIQHAGSAVDAIRIKAHLNRNNDLESREIISTDVVSVIFPVLQDIPMRRLEKTDSGYTVNSLSMQEMFPFELIINGEDQVKRDDLIIKVLRHNNDGAEHSLLVLQVKDSLGNFGSSQLLWKKYTATFYDEYLTPEIVEIIVDMASRRTSLGW